MPNASASTCFDRYHAPRQGLEIQAVVVMACDDEIITCSGFKRRRASVTSS